LALYLDRLLFNSQPLLSHIGGILQPTDKWVIRLGHGARSENGRQADHADDVNCEACCFHSLSPFAPDVQPQLPCRSRSRAETRSYTASILSPSKPVSVIACRVRMSDVRPYL
jgi:hypothetical protein